VLELTAMADAVLDDSRTGQNTPHTMAGLLRQSIFRRLAGHEDSNDADSRCTSGSIRRCVTS
jgi:hypothetical protein